MSNLSEFVGGGKLRTQEFLASGTFTPSTRLLALGGTVLVEWLAGGGSGGLVSNVSSAAAYPSGGSAGQRRSEVLTLTAPVVVTIGAGGTPVTTGTAAALDGTDGGDTTVGALVAKGGARGYTMSTAQTGRGGDGLGGLGASRFSSVDSSALDLRGGRGLDGRGGGGGGSCPEVPTNQLAVDGGGNGRSETISTLTANVTGYAAAANSGAGGGALRVVTTNHDGYTVASGAGGGGWARFVWFE
jgi:hypothetical protein